MSLVRALLFVALIAFIGAAGSPPPFSMWAGWLAITGAGLAIFLVLYAALAWMENPRADDAKRRARLDVRTWRP